MTDPNQPAAPHEETDEERRARHRFDTETAAGAASGDPLAASQLDEADEGTVMVNRIATSPATAEAAADDDVDDGTVMVDRRVAPDDGTVVVDRSEPDEGTIMVDRSAGAADNHDDGTIVVDRTGSHSSPQPSESDDGTVVVDRTGSSPSEPDDGTLVVERPAPPVKRGPVMRTLTRRGRREVTLAPGEGANKSATLAAGAGAVAEYTTRAILAAPVAAPVIELGPEASRANAPSMPSIAKQSRRRGLIALGLTAGAIVISIVGLVLVISALITG